MQKRKLVIQLILIAICAVITACLSEISPISDEGFDDGHDWIMPSPPAEFDLTIVDSNSQPISAAAVYIYLDDTKLEQNLDFVEYNSETGYRPDENGMLKIIYKGDQGGGYEVLADAPGPAELYFVVEAAGYESQRLSVVDYLFRSDLQTGREDREIDGQQFELRMIKDTVILQK